MEPLPAAGPIAVWTHRQYRRIMGKDLNYMRRPPRLTRTTEDSIVLTLFDIANELGKLGDGVSSRAGLTTTPPARPSPRRWGTARRRL